MKYADDRRKRILDAFVTLMGTTAYEDISVRAIANQAGLSTSAIYYYFGSKQEMLYAYFDEYTDRYANELKERISTIPEEQRRGIDLAQFLDLLVRCTFTDSNSQKDCIVDINLMALSLRDKTLAEHYQKATDTYCKAIAQALEFCQVKTDDYNATARLINVALLGLIANRAIFEDSFPLTEVIEQYSNDWMRKQ